MQIGSRTPLRLERLESRLTPVAGYFRVVNYNIAASGGNGLPRTGLDTLLQGMSSEKLNDIGQQADVILLQEVDSYATTSADVASKLNAIYGANTYKYSLLNGTTTGAGTQGLVYNSKTLTLEASATVGVSSGTGMPRQALRYKLQPIGYPTSAAFYAFNSHTKSDTGSTNEGRREDEAIALRASADALPQGTNIFYVGDFNTYGVSEPFFDVMYGAGNGQAFDPINMPGAWHDNNNFVGIFTQAPSSNPPPGLTSGGIDDRFDFILQSNELTDGVGLDYVSGTYHTFGNNGSVPRNGSINDGSSTALPGLANRQQLLDYLTTVSDHLPVVADYRIVGAPVTATTKIDDNTGQRSLVRSVTVDFNKPVVFPNGLAAAFTLTRTDASPPTGAVNLGFAQSGNSVTITFNDATFAPGATKSLIDGHYSLTMNAKNILGEGGYFLDGNANGTGGDNKTVTFHRRFGDSNGDTFVDNVDLLAFRTAMIAGGTSIFDADGDGQTDLTDFVAFRQRLGMPF